MAPFDVENLVSHLSLEAILLRESTDHTSSSDADL
jgi:hypothetical protein